MAKSNNNGFLLGVLIVVALVAAFIKNYKPAPPINAEVVLNEAAVLGPECSGTMFNIRKEIKDLQQVGVLNLTIKPGNLVSPVLGETHVNINSDGIIECTVIIDVEDAIAAGDRVEPLLGHELKHVWDALFLYDKKDPFASASKFISTANEEKSRSYKNREVESSAIGIEDIIRKELILSKNPAFRRLPVSRADADILYAQRAKVNPSLKGVLKQ